MTIFDSLTIFDYPHYEASRKSRLRNFFHHFDGRSLAGKRILEVGCGTGDLGQAFVDVGCRVVSVDARAEYIEELNRRYPDREAHTVDLECWNPTLLGPFDGLLCWGLLYHLSSPGDFLKTCASVAPLIFLETAVSDSPDPICPITAEEGPDQAWSGKGCRPSPAWLRQRLSALGFEVRDISTAEANWDGPAPSVFDWAPLNDGQWQRNGAMLRKMLIATRPTVADHLREMCQANADRESWQVLKAEHETVRIAAEERIVALRTADDKIRSLRAEADERAELLVDLSRQIEQLKIVQTGIEAERKVMEQAASERLDALLRTDAERQRLTEERGPLAKRIETLEAAVKGLGCERQQLLEDRETLQKRIAVLQDQVNALQNEGLFDYVRRRKNIIMGRH